MKTHTILLSLFLACVTMHQPMDAQQMAVLHAHRQTTAAGRISSRISSVDIFEFLMRITIVEIRAQVQSRALMFTRARARLSPSAQR